LDTPRRILVFGESAMLSDLAARLRASPLLDVEHSSDLTTLGNFSPDLILVDAAAIAPEQFSALIASCPSILSIDPETYQLTLHAYPHQTNPLVDVAHVVEIISLCLPRASFIA
jgi:hypothetical protein